MRLGIQNGNDITQALTVLLHQLLKIFLELYLTLETSVIFH